MASECDITVELQSVKVGPSEKRPVEGLSSNRPELVALRKCLEAQEDHINLLYLTDSEPSLQVIHKWVRGGKHDLCTESSRCGYPDSNRDKTAEEG